MQNQEIVIILVAIISYVIGAYISYRIGKNLGVNSSLGYYFIPIYNMVLLAQGAKISIWVILGMFIPFVNLIMFIYFWGKIAEALGKNFWFYGLGSIFLLGIPIYVLAFSSDRKKKVIEGSITDRFNTLGEQDLADHKDAEIETETSTQKKYKIHFISGELAGNSIDFNEGDILTIGRDPSLSNIVINNQKISRQHLEINVSESNKIKLIDLNSSNGSFINNGKQYGHTFADRFTTKTIDTENPNSIMLYIDEEEFGISW